MYNDTYEGVGRKNNLSRRTPKPLNQDLAPFLHYPYSIGIEYIHNFFNIMTESICWTTCCDNISFPAIKQVDLINCAPALPVEVSWFARSVFVRPQIDLTVQC